MGSEEGVFTQELLGGGEGAVGPVGCDEVGWDARWGAGGAEEVEEDKEVDGVEEGFAGGHGGVEG